MTRKPLSSWLAALFAIGPALAGAAPPAPEPDEAGRLVFLIEYIGADYGAAVQNGKIANAFEYQEMLSMSTTLVERFDVLRGRGAAEGLRLDLLRLRESIRELRPWDEVRSLATATAATLLSGLEIVSGPASVPDLARGATLYTANCAPCHGPAGAGDGFADPEMEPRATSFREERMNLLSPHQVYGAISFGIDGTAMPSFLGALPPQQIWEIAFHVLTLREGFEPGAYPLGAMASSGASPRAPGGTAALDVALSLQEAFATVADRLLPSVVSVTSFVRADPAADPVPESSEAWRVSGAEAALYPGFRRLKSVSGFFVSEEGYLLTCFSGLTGADGAVAEVLDVELPNGRHILSRLVGAEPTIDLAVLQLEVFSELQPPAITPVTIGDSDAVRVGHWTIAIGDPWGPERTYAVGTLAAQPLRQCYQDQLSGTLMQASLTVHPESHGGPLVGIRGEVVGLTVPPPGGLSTVPRASEFALPINLALNIYEALKVAESRRSPWLGFSVLELAAVHRREGGGSKPVLPRTGVYLDDVFEPSPASRAGIRAGDCLVSIDGHRLYSVLDFQKWLYLCGIGHTARLEIFREGRTLPLDVTIEPRPPSATTR